MSLLKLREALEHELNSDTAFRFINTRLILRTGVDLQRTDVRAVSEQRVLQVKNELRAMGFLKALDD